MTLSCIFDFKSLVFVILRLWFGVRCRLKSDFGVRCPVVVISVYDAEEGVERIGSKYIIVRYSFELS